MLYHRVALICSKCSLSHLLEALLQVAREWQLVLYR